LRDGRVEQERLVAQNKLLHSEILKHNETIHELNHTIARRRQELQVYEVKLKDWSRREEIALDVC
jgi:cell division protein FtsL